MAIATIPTATPLSPNHWIGLSRSPRKATAMRIVTAGPKLDARPTSHVGAVEIPYAKTASPATSRTPASTTVARTRRDGTMMACAPAVMQREQRFLALLAAVRRFECAGDSLVLRTGDGRAITARR